MTAQRSVVAPNKAKQTIRFPAWPIRLHAADLRGPKQAAEEAGLPAEPDVRDVEDLDSILWGWSQLGMDLGKPALVLEAAKRIVGSLPYEHDLLADADTHNAEIMDDLEDAQEYLLELASTPWGGTAFWHPARDAGTLLNMAAAGDLEAESAWLAVGQRKEGGEWMLLGEAIRRLAVAAGIDTEPFILACHLMREVLLSNEFLQGQEAEAGSWPGCLGRPVRRLPTGLRKVVHEAEAFFQQFRLKVGGPLPARDQSQHPRLLGWRTWLDDFWAGYRKRVVLVQTEGSPEEHREHIEAFMTERSKPGPYLQAQPPADQGTATVGKTDKRLSKVHPSEDFTSMDWGDETFFFSKGDQAGTLQVLYEEAVKGNRTITEEGISERLDTNKKSYRVRKTLKGHRALDRAICSTAKGVWGLFGPDESPPGKPPGKTRKMPG